VKTFEDAAVGRQAQTHKPEFVFSDSHRTKMFHVKHFGTIGGQESYRASDCGPYFDLVRSIDYLVQLQKPGGGAPRQPGPLPENIPNVRSARISRS
jgi:hypothetical protein